MEPELFRKLMSCSKTHFEEARSYYHVSASLERVPDPALVEDDAIRALIDEPDTRQVMHITYGFLLQLTDENGKFLYRDDIFRVLKNNMSELERVTVGHFEKHYEFLGIGKE
jgi:hypothetical protein